MSLPATILVVDDQPINIRIVRARLERAGMKVLSAENGMDAIEIAETAAPDVILLDVMMPELDGIEVCKLLKQNVQTKDIPVIFISAQDSKQGKLEGLQVGAADYITKPIDLDETLARVNTQLRIRDGHRQNLELNRRLSDMRRQVAIAHVAEGIAHNLNNLLGVVSGYLELMRQVIDQPNRVEIQRQRMSTAVQRMVKIVQQLMSVADMDSVRKRPYVLEELVANAVQRFCEEIECKDVVAIENAIPDVVIDTNEELFEDLLLRVLRNSWESYERLGVHTQERKIALTLGEDPRARDRAVIIQVKDEGCGIPAEIRDTVFDPFVTTESEVGRGMGLAIVRHSIQSMGGSIALRDNPKGGTIAEIQHPI
ncbi:MAG: hybrid sensor histidine kinase/response regulator [Verrucomicrobia bacterium]|nr:hybrid sensor histidine kinase/response regulator [Verrucomicrobiota bacterium]